MSPDKKTFRDAYIVQSTQHNFYQLLEFCADLRFVTTGYENYEKLPEIIAEAMENFDPEKDIVVPVGNVASNLLCGITVAKICKLLNIEKIPIAFYNGENYIVCYITA